MPKLVALIIVLVAAVGGGAGGYFAKQMLGGGKADAASDEHGAASEDDHGSTKGGDKKAKDDHGSSKGDDGHKKSADKSHAKSGDKGHGDKAGAPPDGVNYFKFSRQFVVPIVEEDGVRALVLLDLNLEMDASAAESFYVREPKLRDALMEELLDIANEGRFDGVLTDRRNLDLVRVDLLNAVQDVEGDSIHNVLILDIMRQDL